MIITSERGSLPSTSDNKIFERQGDNFFHFNLNLKLKALSNFVSSSYNSTRKRSIES